MDLEKSPTYVALPDHAKPAWFMGFVFKPHTTACLVRAVLQNYVTMMNYCKEMSYGGCAFPAMFSKPRSPQARRIRSPNHYALNSLIKTSGSHCSFGNTNLNVTVCRSPSYCISTPIQSIGHFSWHVFKLKQIEPRSSFTCLARISLSLFVSTRCPNL